MIHQEIWRWITKKYPPFWRHSHIVDWHMIGFISPLVYEIISTPFLVGKSSAHRTNNQFRWVDCYFPTQIWINYVCMYVYIYIFMCMYIYIYMHTEYRIYVYIYPWHPHLPIESYKHLHHHFLVMFYYSLIDWLLLRPLNGCAITMQISEHIRQNMCIP